MFLFYSTDNNWTLLNGTKVVHSGEETDLWVPVEGLVPFTNYTVQVNASGAQGSLLSDPATLALPPGGKSENDAGYLHLH